MKKQARYFFNAVYNKNPCDSTIYILLFLPSYTTSWIFYNAETQQHQCQSNSPNATTVENYKKNGY